MATDLLAVRWSVKERLEDDPPGGMSVRSWYGRLARCSGISENTFWRWLSGQRKPHLRLGMRFLRIEAAERAALTLDKSASSDKVPLAMVEQPRKETET